MKVTPLVPTAGHGPSGGDGPAEGDGRRQVIEAYGDGRFRIAGLVREGSVLVFPRRTLAWPVQAIAALSPQELARSLAPVLAPADQGEGARPELLLVGGGARLVPIPPEVAASLRAAGIVVEAMDTGAACRTFNVLLAEDRPVVAALIAV